MRSLTANAFAQACSCFPYSDSLKDEGFSPDETLYLQRHVFLTAHNQKYLLYSFALSSYRRMLKPPSLPGRKKTFHVLSL